jgi:hypothetical protein
MLRRCLLVLVVAVAIVYAGEFFCFGGWYRVYYGRPRLTTKEYLESHGKLRKGMTFDEVRNAIGEPHKKWSNFDGSTSWRYYVPSSFSPIEDGFFGVEFDANGRMVGDWIP